MYSGHKNKQANAGFTAGLNLVLQWKRSLQVGHAYCGATGRRTPAVLWLLEEKLF